MKKHYRVSTQRNGVTVIQGYRGTLKGARTLLHQKLREGALAAKIDLLVNAGLLTDGWQMIENTIMPRRSR